MWGKPIVIFSVHFTTHRLSARSTCHLEKTANREYENSRARRLAEFFLEARDFSFFVRLSSFFPLIFFRGVMSNERTLPRRRAAACPSWVIRREGAKKWSDQCQISAFTASVCDPQRRPRARFSQRLMNYLRTHTGIRHTCATRMRRGGEKRGTAETSPSALPNAHYPHQRRWAISLRNEQKTREIMKPSEEKIMIIFRTWKLANALALEASRNSPASGWDRKRRCDTKGADPRI